MHMNTGKKPAALNVELLRSRRKTLALEIAKDGRILVRAPLRCPEREIRAFVEKSRPWLERKLAERERQRAEAQSLPPLTEEELRALKAEAKAVFAARAAHFAPLVGVSFTGLTVRSQRSKWGSCSSKGSLSFNCLLLLAPPEALDYVVVHELCHRLEMNHSPRFWREVARVLPGYEAPRRWLREHGGALLARLPA